MQRDLERRLEELGSFRTRVVDENVKLAEACSYLAEQTHDFFRAANISLRDEAVGTAPSPV
ncbi:MAG TPA: hypothetical protein VFL57_09795 [Bryobacteraceae bacterium]|nr:hypothetical protein [Bryobacteraceae bacterium]